MKSSLVFLSHAGEDAKLALQLADQLKRDLSAGGLAVRVFNTSAPEDRFRDFADIVASGQEFRPAEWETELKKYLRENIGQSAAYILLVTPTSMHKSSKWIQFEIDTAHEEHARRDIGFIPCAADGALLKDLPPKASVFQGINLSKEQGWYQTDRAYEQLLRAVSGFVERAGSQGEYQE